MRLGILGGTFDPPHLGHLLIAEYALDALQLDTILFIPTGAHPLKENSEYSDPLQRSAMTKLAVSDNPKFELSDIEIKRNGISYTIDTIREIKSVLNPERLFVIIGADNVDLFPKWHKIDEVLAESSVVVCNRIDIKHTIPQEVLDRVQILDSPIIEISSTDIRERLRNGHSIRYFVPDGVWQYIEENRLYLD